MDSQKVATYIRTALARGVRESLLYFGNSGENSGCAQTLALCGKTGMDVAEAERQFERVLYSSGEEEFFAEKLEIPVELATNINFLHANYVSAKQIIFLLENDLIPENTFYTSEQARETLTKYRIYSAV